MQLLYILWNAFPTIRCNQRLLEKIGLEKKNTDEIFYDLSILLDRLQNDIKNNAEDFETSYGKMLYELVLLGRCVKLKSETTLHKYNLGQKEKYQKLFELAYTRGIPLDENHASDLIGLLKEIKND